MADLLDVTVSRRLVIPMGLVVRYCRQGRLQGAYFDRATWHWRIPCPIRLMSADDYARIAATGHFLTRKRLGTEHLTAVAGRAVGPTAAAAAVHPETATQAGSGSRPRPAMPVQP